MKRPPDLNFNCINTSKQHQGAKVINRYWLGFLNHANSSNLVIRLDFPDKDGNTLFTASVKLPRSLSAESRWIQIDGVDHDTLPASIRYFTVSGILTKSESATALMDGKFEDLSSLS